MKKDGLCRVCGCQKNLAVRRTFKIEVLVLVGSPAVCWWAMKRTVGRMRREYLVCLLDDFQMKLNFNLKVPLYACAIEADESFLSMCLVG